MAKTILAVLMLATILFSVGCSNTSSGTGGNNVTKADLDKLSAEMRDEIDALGVRLAELEKKSKSGGVNKVVLDKFTAEFRDEFDALGVRVAEIEKRLNIKY